MQEVEFFIKIERKKSSIIKSEIDATHTPTNQKVWEFIFWINWLENDFDVTDVALPYYINTCVETVNIC